MCVSHGCHWDLHLGPWIGQLGLAGCFWLPNGEGALLGGGCHRGVGWKMGKLAISFPVPLSAQAGALNLAALLGLTWAPPPKAEICMGQWGRRGAFFWAGLQKTCSGAASGGAHLARPSPARPGGGLTQEQQRRTMQKDSMMPEMPTTQVRRRKRMTPKMF